MFSLAATFSASTTPVAAGTQKWSQITLPTDVKGQLLPSTDISTIAVTPDGKTLFAGVCNTSDSTVWSLYKSTDNGYKWTVVSGYDALGISDCEIVSIKVSPDWANDGKIYVAANNATSGFFVKSKDSGKTWGSGLSWLFPGQTINSMDVAIDGDNAIEIVIGTTTSAWLYDGESWKDQNPGGTVPVNALAVAFSPNYSTDGTIFTVADDGTNLRLRAETDTDAHNWGKSIGDSYFTYYNVTTGTRLEIPAETACIAFPSDYDTSRSVFVGLNSEDSGYTVGASILPGTDGTAPQHQTGDAFKVNLASGVTMTSSVTDLNIRGTGTGTDVWSMAICGPAATANIVCGLRYVSQSGDTGNWQGQVHLSTTGGDSWSAAVKPPSGMIADVNLDGRPEHQFVGLAAPVVVMAPDFATSSTVYCANGYYSGTGGVVLSGFYVSTDNGAIWNGRGLLDRSLGALDREGAPFPAGLVITDIVPSAQYETDNTIYMVTIDKETIVMQVQIGLLWKTTDGGAHWQIICDMIPLATITSELNAILMDKVAVAGDNVFIAGANGVLGAPYDTIFRSGDGGQSFASSIATRVPVQHLLAIDQTNLITANESQIWKTVNGGNKWTQATIDLATGETICDMVMKGNTILVGTNQGNVWICDDYTSDAIMDFTQVADKAVGNSSAGDTVVVAFDNNYGTNHIIYAGVTGSKSGIWRNVDDATTWEQLEFNMSLSDNYSAKNSNIAAISCDSNGILWAICTATNGSATKGIPIRSVNPTEATVSKVAFDMPTTSLTSTLTGNLNVVGSTETFAVGGVNNNEIWIYTDTLIKPTLVSPTNGATAAGDLLSGTSFARVVLTWTYLAKADSYQYQVALDQDFNNIVTDSTGALVNGTITGTSLNVQLYAGTKYYWRVRVATGVNSQWSDVWSFTTPLGPSAEAPTLVSPTAGQVNVSLLPVLQWSGLAGATKYELQVAKGCDFSGSNLIVDKTGSNALEAGSTAYQITQGLINGSSYCWKVRALGTGTNSAWSNTGTFTTVQAAVPAKEESTPTWVWLVIALSAVLLVSIVILIIRTRRA